MFGFGKAPDHFSELLEYLVESWGMRTKHASDFLTAYRSNISKMHDQGLKNLEHIRANGDPDQKLLSYTIEPMDYTVVGQAYQGYLTDLRRGKHVNTAVELTIWAILVNRIDILESIDRGLANFIWSKHEERFPDLLDQVFNRPE